MTRHPALAAAALAAIFAAGGPAAAEKLVTSTSRHQVLVNSSFTGTSIVLFGTVEPDGPGERRRATSYDVVVTVTGPKQTIVARRKERVLGIWTNMASRTFVEVPSYLAVLSTQPPSKLTSDDTVKRLQIGIDNMLLRQQTSPNDRGSDIGRDAVFRANFIRLKTQHRLYVQKTNGVTRLTPTVFRAEIPLPAETPIGVYNVDVKVFAEGAMIVRAASAFEIVKTGFEQFVATAAQEYGVLYGLATAMMALVTGWFASVVFRRD
jgi:uncharacterized protein (TIGR02186 family)